MPASVECVRTLAAPEPHRPMISLRWKKWMKTNDPAAYKGCVVFLLTLYQLYCLRVELCFRMREDGSAHVWWWARRGMDQLVALSRRSCAMLMTSLLVQVWVLLSGDMYLYSRHDHVFSGSVDTALSELNPFSEEQLYSTLTAWPQALPFPGCLMVLVPHVAHVAIHLWKYIEQYFTATTYKKCMKMPAVEAISVANDYKSSFVGRTVLRLGVLMVVVNQMLLMMAGDVERNPGPESLNINDLRTVREAIFSAKDKWYDIGLELQLSPTVLDGIQNNKKDPGDCLREMLKHWLSSKYPTWDDIAQALSSAPVGEQRLAEHIKNQHCSQDGGPAASQAPDLSSMRPEPGQQMEIVPDTTDLRLKPGQQIETVPDTTGWWPLVEPVVKDLAMKGATQREYAKFIFDEGSVDSFKKRVKKIDVSIPTQPCVMILETQSDNSVTVLGNKVEGQMTGLAKFAATGVSMSLGGIGGVYAGAATGALIGSVAGPVGAGVGGLIGSVTGFISGAVGGVATAQYVFQHSFSITAEEIFRKLSHFQVDGNCVRCQVTSA